MVMRVWVLASCGSLLALSACSAEPTTTAQPSPLDPSDDDLQTADRPAARDHAPGTVVDIERDLIRPELRPTRSQRPPSPSPARTQRHTLTPEQLRERVAQVRAQQIQQSRAPGRAPGMAQIATPPQTSQADGADVSLRPGMVPTATLTITPLTPPPRPTLSPVALAPSMESDSTPSSVAASVAPTNLDNGGAVFLGEESTQAADLGAPEPATLARNFPLRSTAHQSDGARHRQDSVVISVAQPSELVDVAQRESPYRGTDEGINTAHHSPWMTAEQAASEQSSQPLLAQTEPQTRSEQDSPSLALSSDTDARTQGDSVQPELPPVAPEFHLAPATPETVSPESVSPEAVSPESVSPEAISSEPLSLAQAAPADWPGVEIGGEAPHWSALGPEVSVSAVPTSWDSPRFANPRVHQSSDHPSDYPSEIAAPTAEVGLAEPAAALPNSEEWATSEPSPHCEPPTLAKPLPSDTLADSAILEAKGIPGESAAEEIAAEEIAVVDCP